MLKLWKTIFAILTALLVGITSAWSLLTTAGIGGGWWNGKILNIQLYKLDKKADTATIQWNKVVGATSYCIVTLPYFWTKRLQVADCVNIGDGGSDPYVGQYTIAGKINWFGKEVYIGVMKGDKVVYIEKMDNPLWDFKVVKNTDDFKLIVDTTGKPIYAEDWMSDDWFAYLLADNIDYDGDGMIEWCYEDIWYDKNNCVLYIYNKWLYVSPPTNGNTDIQLVNNNYDWKHPNNARDFCKSKSWFGKNFYLPTLNDLYQVYLNKKKIVGLKLSSRYWSSNGSKTEQPHWRRMYNGWTNRIWWYGSLYVRCISK